MKIKKKQILALVCSLVMTLSFVMVTQAKEWRLRSADVMSQASPYGEGMVKFGELIKERSNGKIVIKHFPSAQLGKDDAIIAGVKMGTIDIAVTGGLGSKVLSGFVSPFLFEDYIHLDRFFASPVWEDIKKAYQKETGIHMVGGAYFPPRMLTTKNTKIETPNDCKGLKIRVPTVPAMVKTWKALGASPTPIAFAELFTALQQGTVDAQENPLQIIYDQSFFEVQKYVIPIKYMIPPRFLILNQELWDELGPENQEIVKLSWREAALFIQKMYLEKDSWYESQLKAKGMIFTNPDIKLFRDATVQVTQSVTQDAWGSGIHEEIRAMAKQ